MYVVYIHNLPPSAPSYQLEFILWCAFYAVVDFWLAHKQLKRDHWLENQQMAAIYAAEIQALIREQANSQR